ncbi:DUF1840 domain-containing protein [Undibacterium macrobrachii]|jgi:uncharacterized membrane protein|uniref:DUF1840 domain-containing protein n=1 Tax=Undibacterium macrobrachii TaxID=1119058 RepID=A0ABQ2XBV1_9BURK|nr:DUF1840 domain-containing protein [Undibacterium macrobrachii]GGX09233.1 hypothetical protein GCM10011282_14330 [Undibacterium macrobrachii]
MLIIFKSKAAAEVIMYKEHIASVLEMLNKNVDRGVITAAESENAIQQIEQLIEADKQQRLQQEKMQLEDEEDLDEIEKRKKRDFVSLSARLYPILEMLKAANKKQTDVLWGI